MTNYWTCRDSTYNTLFAPFDKKSESRDVGPSVPRGHVMDYLAKECLSAHIKWQPHRWGYFVSAHMDPRRLSGKNLAQWAADDAFLEARVCSEWMEARK